MMPPFVSVLIVNYNGRRFLADCLDSLANQSYSRHRFEVILLDNASNDDSVEFIRRHYPWVRLLLSKENTGFAQGNNLALQAAHGDWIALLNSDAAAAPDWVESMVMAGSTHSDIGGVACRLVFRDRPTITNGTGLHLLRDGRGADRDFGKPVAESHQPSGEVFGGCGAALVLRRSMLDSIGLFDSRLFMYYEDLDLAWRARRAGWRFVFCPNTQVQHVFGASAGVASPKQIQFVERNRVLVNLKHAPIWLAVGAVLGLIGRCGRAIVRRFKVEPAANVAAHCRALSGAFACLPRFVVSRCQLKQQFGSSDRVYRRWSRPRS